MAWFVAWYVAWCMALHGSVAAAHQDARAVCDDPSSEAHKAEQAGSTKEHPLALRVLTRLPGPR